jgi:AcrR family transcriptional regulator
VIVAAGEDAARLMLAHPRRFTPERLTGLARELISLVPGDARPRGHPVPTLSAPPAPPPPPEPGTDGATPRRRVPQVERREQLLDVTLALLAEEGFAALSMEAIARRAQVNRAVVYRSFANLHVLLAALLHREDRRVRQTLDDLLPDDPGGHPPSQLLGESLARFLSAVMAQPQTWRVALLRPESAPVALQKVVNRRRSALARRLEPLVSWGIARVHPDPARLDVEALARMLLSVCEEQGRLLLDDPQFSAERLMQGSWALLDTLPA